MAILLIDPSNMSPGGHHRLYKDALLQIAGTEFFDKQADLPDLKRNPIAAVLTRKRYVDELPTADIACLLYFDGLCKYPSVVKAARRKTGKLVAVQHWFPEETIRQKLFVRSAKQLDVLVVHSEYTQRECEAVGLDNVITIDYPCFCTVGYDALSVVASSNKKTFTCLGGQREDKGLDVLAASFAYLPEEVCDKVRFVVAGKEGDYPYARVKQLAVERGIEVVFDNRVLPDEDYWRYVKQSDVILLPYKRVFSGNSGPMTDGVWANKYILGPDWGNLGYLINKHQLGSTFTSEDPASLAGEIARVAGIDTTCEHKYREKLNVAEFVDAWRRLFEG